MIPGLEPVSLRDLQALGACKRWPIEGSLDDLPSLTPVRGELQAEHFGNLLALQGRFETIVTLCCDRCLGQYNHRLQADVEELIWLGDAENETAMAEAGLGVDGAQGLVECLDPRGSFEPERWVFEQLNLQLPVVNRCGLDCPGMPPERPRSQAAEHKDDSLNAEPSDPRWAALRKLRGEGG